MPVTVQDRVGDFYQVFRLFRVESELRLAAGSMSGHQFGISPISQGPPRPNQRGPAGSAIGGLLG